MKIAGYAAVFNTADLAGDLIKPGAFKETLKNRPPAEIDFLYQHDSGRKIGRWHKIYEDDFGLWVEGEIHVELKYGFVAALIAAGRIDGLSIGFIATEYSILPQNRILHSVDLREISLVGFPMHREARLQRLGWRDAG